MLLRDQPHDKPHGQLDARPADQGPSPDAGAKARSETRLEEETGLEDQSGNRTKAGDDGRSDKTSWEQDANTWRSRLARHAIVASAAAVIFVAAVAAGVIWWLNAREYESTDDAFIDARTVSISSQISGAIIDVPVTDNQLVDAGGVLVRIDERDYRAAVNLASAQIDQAQATIANLDAQIEAQQARND